MSNRHKYKLNFPNIVIAYFELPKHETSLFQILLIILALITLLGNEKNAFLKYTCVIIKKKRFTVNGHIETN